MDYKELINAAKPDKNSLSSYLVRKRWGAERWIEHQDNYVVKIINMNKGERSSLQYHQRKIEVNVVLSGSAEVEIDGIKKTYNAGEGWIVNPLEVHRVVALETYSAVEVSTPDLDDCIRLADDYNRPSGKIESEHPK